MLTEDSLSSYPSSEPSIFMSFLPVCYTVWSQWAALGAKKGKHRVIPAVQLQEYSLYFLILVKHFLFHGKQSNLSRRYLDCYHHYATTPQPGPDVDRWDGKLKTPFQETQEFMPSFCLKTIHLNHYSPKQFLLQILTRTSLSSDRIVRVHGRE